MNIVKAFEYNQSKVRTITINQEPWFVAQDICDILDISNVSQTLGRLDDDEKGIYSIDTLGGKQDLLCVSEAGLYTLVLGSRKPEAKPFKRWVTHEVLPSIRKTGKYEVNAQPVLPPHKIAVEKADAIAHITETLSHNHPRLAQLLIDHSISDIMPTKLLNGVRLRGVVEIAEDMGFKCDHSSRVRLGQFVASSEVSHLKQSEDRLCNGTVRPVNCYPDTEEVRAVIKQFFK